MPGVFHTHRSFPRFVTNDQIKIGIQIFSKYHEPFLLEDTLDDIEIDLLLDWLVKYIADDATRFLHPVVLQRGSKDEIFPRTGRGHDLTILRRVQ